MSFGRQKIATTRHGQAPNRKKQIDYLTERATRFFDSENLCGTKIIHEFKKENEMSKKHQEKLEKWKQDRLELEQKQHEEFEQRKQEQKELDQKQEEARKLRRQEQKQLDLQQGIEAKTSATGGEEGA